MRRVFALMVAAGLLVGGLVLGPVRATSLPAPVPTPTVTGPITGGIHGHPLFDSWFDLSALGYEEAEYFVSGVAQSSANGNTTAPYTTRIIVTRPSDKHDFNGTVLLDWTNVTAQFENAVDSVEAHEYLLREGYAFVHVSAQAAGVCCTPLTPKIWDPVRYAPLSHPGDDFANSMFSQVAQAFRTRPAVKPLGKLQARRILAAGQSQSASRLYNYVTTAQPTAGVIDGFLIHGGGSKQYEVPPAVPVLHLLSDAEASPAAPNSTQNYRLWEVAGAAHSDFWIGYHSEVGQGPRVLADAPKQPAKADEEMHAVAGNYGEQVHPMQAVCVAAGSLFPMRYTTSSAIDSLDRWVRDGTAPPNGPRFAFDGDQLARDDLGNALGGIRLPPIVHPMARYQSTVCELGGLTVPLTELEIQQRYPSHAQYYAGMAAATEQSVRDGFLLREDAADLLHRACGARNRWLSGATADCG